MTPKVDRETSNKRLLKLARFLEKLPNERFNYAYWVGKDWKGASDLSCGTTACALGWAAVMPEFRKLGLELRRDPNIRPILPIIQNRNTGSGFISAAMEIFGLTLHQAEKLFIPYTYPPSRGRLLYSSTAKEVAAHIRRFVAR
jgi:hypothetical protein